MEQREYFDRAYGEKSSYLLDTSANMRLLIEKRLTSALALLAPTGKERVLDIGCGEGFFSARLAEKARHVTGVDISRVGIRKARALHRGRKNLSFRAADAYRLPFKAGSFDAVTALEVIEHLDKPERFLSECRRALKPGGALILSTPNRLCLVNRVRLLLGRQVVYFGLDHVTEYTIGELREMLSEAGFSIKKISAHLLELPIPRFERLLPTRLFGVFIALGGFLPPAARIICLRAEKKY